MESASKSTSKDEKKDESIIVSKIPFECALCKLRENVDYKGVKPPFVKEIILKEASYVMKDPFTDPAHRQILVIGNDCSICEKMVCLGKECSIFYTKTFCLLCAKENKESFPSAIKSKLI